MGDAGTGDQCRQRGFGTAGDQGCLESVEHPDGARWHERGLGTHRPGRRTQDLQGLVDGAAPGLDREAGPGQDQGADRAGLLPEVVGSLVPGVGHGAEAGVVTQVTAPRRRAGRQQRHGQSGQHHRGRHPPGPRVGTATRSPRQRGLCGRREPEGQHHPNHRVELVHVAERGEGAVEGSRPGMVEQRAGQAAAAGGQREQSDQEGDHQGTPVRQPTRAQAEQSQPGHERGGDEQARPRGQSEAGLPARAVAGGQEGDPVVGAAQRREPPDQVGRRPRGLDIAEEGRAVAAQHQQRQQPPQRHQHDEACPATEQGQPRTPRQSVDQQQDRREGQRRQHLGGVVATHERDRCRREQRRATRREPTPQRKHQRQHGPREDAGGECLTGERADGAQQSRREHVGEPGEHGRPGAEAAPGTHDPAHPFVRQQQEQRAEQPLPHPHRHVQHVSEQVDGTEGEEVSRGLVLQLAQRRVGVPEREAAHQEAAGVELEVELGVEGDPAGLLGQVDRHDRDHQQGVEPARDDRPGGEVSSPGHVAVH